MPQKTPKTVFIAIIGICSGMICSCGDETLTVHDNSRSCENTCRTGTMRCFGETQFESCIVKLSGCAAWSEPQICPNGARCIANACQSCPSPECTAGEKSCSEDGARICGDFDGDGCPEWSRHEPCKNGCNGDACNLCTGPECTDGEKSCDEDGARICGDFDGDGCPEWSSFEVCPDGCEGNACKTAPAYVRTRYPGNAVISPITPYVADQMRNIRKNNDARNDASFMKMGDSHMYAQSSFMYCFSTNSSKHVGYNLDGLDVTDAVSAFQADFDAFARVSSVTILGETSNLPIKNDHKLLNEEIAATNPRFAFYGYGTNDMGWYDYRKFKSASGGGYFAAMQLYYRNVLAAMDKLTAAGIIPMIIGTGMRNDRAKYYNTATYVEDEDSPKHFVTTFNAISRGIAEYYQIPYYNLQLSHESVGNYGLSTDGIHHITRNNGCDFTSYGLEAGANLRNRHAIEMLRRAWRVAVNGEDAPDGAGHPFEGSGSHADPFIISDLPYTHMGTTKGGEKIIGIYGCSATAKEYGPEKVYRLTVSSKTRIRAFVMSATQTDADIHLLGALSGNACRVRGDKWIEAPLDSGTYYFVVDTYNATHDDTNAGRYLFGIHECDEDDASCGAADLGE